MQQLNAEQLEILKLFQVIDSKQDLEELKMVLSQYLAKKLTEEADRVVDERGYTRSEIEGWQYEHFRRKTT